MKKIIGLAIAVVLILAGVLKSAEVRHITQIADTRANLISNLDTRQIAMTTDTIPGIGAKGFLFCDPDTIIKYVGLLGFNAYFRTLTCTTLNNVGTFNVVDNVFNIVDNGDNTRKVQFNAAAISDSTTRIIAVPNVSGTLALLNVDNYFTGNDTFSQSITVPYLYAAAPLGLPDLRIVVGLTDSVLMDSGYFAAPYLIAKNQLKFSSAASTDSMIFDAVNYSRFTSSNDSIMFDGKVRIHGGLRSYGKDTLKYANVDTMTGRPVFSQGFKSIGGGVDTITNKVRFTGGIRSASVTADTISTLHTGSIVGSGAGSNMSLYTGGVTNGNGTFNMYGSVFNMKTIGGDSGSVLTRKLIADDSVRTKYAIIDSLKRRSWAESLQVKYVNHKAPYLAFGFTRTAAQTGGACTLNVSAGYTDTLMLRGSSAIFSMVDSHRVYVSNDTVIFQEDGDYELQMNLCFMGQSTPQVDSIRVLVELDTLGNTAKRRFIPYESLVRLVNSGSATPMPFQRYIPFVKAGDRLRFMFTARRTEANPIFYSANIIIRQVHPNW